MHAVLPALRAARDELQTDLQKWLAEHPDGAEQFTAYQKKQALASLEASMERIAELQPAMAQALGVARNATGGLASANLHDEIARMSSIFGGGMIHLPQIDTAAVIAQGNKLLWKRHERSAKRYAGSIGDDIRTRLAVSLAKGDTFDQMSRRLRGSPEFKHAVAMSDPGAAAFGIADAAHARWRHWADRLVRTENMHAYNVQHDLAIEHVNENRHEDEDEYLRRWDATADNIACPRCAALDRTVATIKGDFAGGIHSPPLHPYCFLPGTRVAGRVVAAMRSHYAGDAVEIETASGARLRVTVNHPVATPRGFVAASTIRRGDKVLSQRGDVWTAARRGVNKHDKPPTIDEIFSALAMQCQPLRTASANHHLHGDAAGGDGHIDIVTVDRVLRDHPASTLANGIRELLLPFANADHAARSCACGADLPLGRDDGSANRIMGLGHLESALVDAHAGPLHRLALGLPAQGNTPLSEYASDDIARDPEAVGKLIDGLPGEIALDEVLSVRQFYFSGHVYDLQTATGWIVAQGIYTSNCRCVVLAWLARWGDMKGEVPALHHGGDEEIQRPHQSEKQRARKEAENKAAAAEDLAEYDRHKAQERELQAAKERQARQLEAHKAKRAAVTRQPAPAQAAVLPQKQTDEQAAEAAARAVLEKKNPKRQAAARKAAEASAERRREIHSAVATNLPQELQAAWDKEGHRFMQQQAGRIKGIKDRINASSKLSEAFAEQYGSGEQTTHGNEGDRSHRRAEIDAKHAESWADEQERKYYERAQAEAQHSRRHEVFGAPTKIDDDDPPF